jgi:cytochrome P450
MRPSEVVRPAGPKASPRSVLRFFAGGRGRVLDLLTDIARRYPRVACFRLFGETAYLVSEPELIREVLVVQGRALKKGRGLEQASRLLGNGLLTSEGEDHREQRKLIQPAFHGERVRAYAEQMASAAEGVEWADGARIDLAAEMAGLTLDVVGRTLFGVDLTGSAADVRTALTEFLEAFNQVAGPGGGLLLRVRPGLRKRLDEAQATLDRVVYELIASRRERLAAGIPGDDLVSLLLPTGMSDAELRDQAPLLTPLLPKGTPQSRSAPTMTGPSPGLWWRKRCGSTRRRMSSDAGRSPTSSSMDGPCQRDPW